MRRIQVSMYGAVLQRTREIGILRSMGASKLFVMRMVLTEAVLFGLNGAVFGVVLSLGMREVLTNLGLAASRRAMTWEWWPFIVCGVVGTAILGACYPSISAARLNLVDALTYED
jgi:putative ABC transport system permease protein